MIFLSVSCLLWNKGVGSAEVLVEDGAFLKKVLEKSIDTLGHTSSSKDYNFGVYSIFSLINVSLGLGGNSIIEERQ